MRHSLLLLSPALTLVLPFNPQKQAHNLILVGQSLKYFQSNWVSAKRKHIGICPCAEMKSHTPEALPLHVRHPVPNTIHDIFSFICMPTSRQQPQILDPAKSSHLTSPVAVHGPLRAVCPWTRHLSSESRSPPVWGQGDLRMASQHPMLYVWVLSLAVKLAGSREKADFGLEYLCSVVSRD